MRQSYSRNVCLGSPASDPETGISQESVSLASIARKNTGRGVKTWGQKEKQEQQWCLEVNAMPLYSRFLQIPEAPAQRVFLQQQGVGSWKWKHLGHQCAERTLRGHWVTVKSLWQSRVQFLSPRFAQSMAMIPLTQLFCSLTGFSYFFWLTQKGPGSKSFQIFMEWVTEPLSELFPDSLLSPKKHFLSLPKAIQILSWNVFLKLGCQANPNSLFLFLLLFFCLLGPLIFATLPLKDKHNAWLLV